MKNRTKTAISSLLMVSLITSVLLVAISFSSLAVSAEPQFLNIIISPSEAKLNVGQTQVFTATPNNGTEPFEYYWSLTPESNDTKLMVDGNMVNVTFVDATEQVFWLHVRVVDALSRCGYADAKVYDPYNNPNLYLDTSIADYSYKIESDGLGWHRYVNGSTGQVVQTSTNARMILVNAIGNLSSGGSIFVKSGSYVVDDDYLSLNAPKLKLYGEGESTIFQFNSTDKYIYFSDNNEIEISNIQFQVITAGRTVPILAISTGSVYLFRAWIHNCHFNNTLAVQGNYVESDIGLKVGRYCTFGIFESLYFDNIGYALLIAPDIEWANGNRFSEITIRNAKVGVEMTQGAGDKNLNTFSNFQIESTLNTSYPMVGFNITGTGNEFYSNVFYKDGTATLTAYNITASATDTLIDGGSVETAIPIVNAGTNTHIKNVRNFVTENSGSVTNTTATTCVFNHGLAGTPNAGISAICNDTALTLSVTAITSTQITITKTGTPSGNWTVYWHAEYHP